MTDKNRIVESKDKDDNTVKVKLTVPTPQEYRDSQVEYNKAFRAALDSGALLRQKLSDYMEEQGIWNDEKQKQNDKFIEEINQKEDLLKGGGIPLSEAKQIALELRGIRSDFREFLSEKNAMDQNSAEGQADNARFSELVRLCMVNPNNDQPYFPTQKDYDESSDQPWVIEAASELAGMIYGLDPNYDNKLEENKFLKEFEFCNDDLRLVDKDGHLVDVDGRLITEEGRFVAYRTEEGRIKQDEEDRYYINRKGDEVIEVTDADGVISWEKPSLAERKPFLDDGGKPIEVNKIEVDGAETVSEKPKRRKKSTKVESDTEAS